MTDISLLPDSSSDDALCHVLGKLEILDGRGGEILKELLDHYSEIAEAEPDFRTRYRDQLPLLFSRFAVYLIYRYTIDSFYENSLEREIRLWNRSLRLLLLMCINYDRTEHAFGVGPMINLSHTFSRQIEHSDENIEKMKSRITVPS